MPAETRPAAPRLPPTWTAGRVVLADEASWDGVAVGGSFAGQAASLVDVTGCRLSGAAFTGAEIDRLRLADTVLEDYELSGAALTRLAAVRVEFRRCRLSGLRAAGAECKDVDNVSLHRSTLESLRGADGLRGAVVGTDQVLPLALSVFAALGIRVDDTADPDA